MQKCSHQAYRHNDIVYCTNIMRNESLESKGNFVVMEIFTEREREVLYWLLLGLNNQQISKKLFISNHTTKAHVASIYKKLGVLNRVQAAVKSLSIGAGEYFNLKEKIL